MQKHVLAGDPYSAAALCPLCDNKGECSRAKVSIWLKKDNIYLGDFSPPGINLALNRTCPVLFLDGVLHPTGTLNYTRLLK